MKRRLRRATDRVMLPYVDMLRTPDPTAPAPPVAEEVGSPGPVPSVRFHNLNHALRTIALEQAPKGARRAVSIGASGRWYFDWFEASVGPLDVHVGVEAFEPRPDDLPPYVTWVTNTADHMDDVASGSADLVFAGQTTEHLWAHELSGFLLEAHRVLSVGGALVLDSPNRLVTEHLHWSHGGHTVELSTAEISELLDLAGFDVTTRRGIWRCRFGDDVLQLEDRLDDDETVARRIGPGDLDPDDCFIWWVEAARADRPPQAAALTERIAQLYAQHWPVRLCRGMWPGPDVPSLPVMSGFEGPICRNLPFPLHPGRWELEVPLLAGRTEDLTGLRAAIVAPGDHLIHDLPADAARWTDRSVTWEFEHHHLYFALSIELAVEQVLRDVEIAMPLRLAPVG